MDKLSSSAAAAVRDIADGASILIGGFGPIQGWPISLIKALHEHGARNLTLIMNTPGVGPLTPQILAESGQIRKLIATYAAYPTRRTPVEECIRDGVIELELVPQGTLVERLRAGGAGLAAFYTPTSVGTPIAAGKEERQFGGRRYVLETSAARRLRVRPRRTGGPPRQPRLPARLAQLQPGVRYGRHGHRRRGRRRRRAGRDRSRGGGHTRYLRRPRRAHRGDDGRRGPAGAVRGSRPAAATRGRATRPALPPG